MGPGPGINAGKQTPVFHSADDALRQLLLTMKKPLFFSDQEHINWLSWLSRLCQGEAKRP